MVLIIFIVTIGLLSVSLSLSSPFPLNAVECLKGRTLLDIGGLGRCCFTALTHLSPSSGILNLRETNYIFRFDPSWLIAVTCFMVFPEDPPKYLLWAEFSSHLQYSGCTYMQSQHFEWGMGHNLESQKPLKWRNLKGSKSWKYISRTNKLNNSLQKFTYILSEGVFEKQKRMAEHFTQQNRQQHRCHCKHTHVS